MATTVPDRPQLLIVGAIASVLVLGVAALVGLAASRGPDKAEVAPAKAGDAEPRRAGVGSCANCGTVEAIRAVVVTASPEGAKRTVYRITVRMDDGSFRTLSQPLPPSVAVGEAVRISEGAVVRPPAPDTKG
jgi:hypothetical protein